MARSESATPEAGNEYTVMVRITCSNQGVAFEAITDESFGVRLGFRDSFATQIAAMAQRRVQRPRIDDTPRPGLLIAVEPQRNREAKAEFGADLPALGITPVRVKIDNRTTRTYGFQSEKVQLVTQDGRRVAALPLEQVIGKVDAQARAAVREKSIADGDLSPGASRSGFLYFPASAYRRAKVVVMDRDNDEAEGFSVEF